MLVVVLSFDSLATRFLGPYGSELSLTPGFDHLASASLVFGNARAAAVGGDSINVLLTGRHHVGERDQSELWSGWERLSESGVTTELLVEAPSMQLPNGLPPATHVTPVDGQDGPDVDDFETPFGQLIAEGRPMFASFLGSSVRMRESHEASEPLIYGPLTHKLTQQFITLFEEMEGVSVEQAELAVAVAEEAVT